MASQDLADGAAPSQALWSLCIRDCESPGGLDLVTTCSSGSDAVPCTCCPDWSFGAPSEGGGGAVLLHAAKGEVGPR